MTKNDLAMLLMCSLRYAYGRRSYITGAVADCISGTIHDLSEIDARKIVTELEKLLETEDSGMDMDRAVWENCLGMIKSDLGI